RTAINHDEEFKRLRGDITQYLIKVGIEKSQADDKRTLPSVLPNTSHRKGLTERSNATSFAHDRYVEFSKVSKIYPTAKGPLKVVDEFDLKLKKGEFISLIGHS